MKDLIAQGKVRHFGLSEAGASHHPPRARGAARHGYPKRIFALVAQPEAEVLPTCEELGIGFVPFSPLGRGFLTGKMDETTTFGGNDNPQLPCRGSRPRR